MKTTKSSPAVQAQANPARAIALINKGAPVFADKRTKRNRTRATQKRSSLREW